MKRTICLIIFGFLLGGCGMYYVPFEGKLDSLTKRKLQPVPPYPTNIAVYLEKDVSEKIISKKAEGATCGHAVTQIAFGAGFKNAMFKSLSIAFPSVKFLEKPERPKDYNLWKIGVERLDVGFEFSATSACNPPMMDKGRLSITLIAQVFNPENKMVINETFEYEMKEEDHNIPPSSQTGVLEKCVNRAIVQYINAVRKDLQKVQ